MGEGPSRHTEQDRALGQVETLIDVGRLDDAVRLARGVLAKEPGNAPALRYLALAFLRASRLEEALATSELAIAADPEMEYSHRIRSLALTGLGRPREALASAEEARRLAPEEPLALYVHGQAQLACKKTKAARSTAGMLLDLAPGWATSHELLGDIELEGRRWKDAEAHYRSALGIEPESYPAHNNLGVALQGQGRHQEAVEVFHAAARLAPAEPLARDNLVRAVKGTLGCGVLSLWWLLVPVLNGVSRDEYWGSVGSMHAGLVVTVVLLLGVGVVVGGYCWWRHRKLSRLPEPVVRLYEERRKEELRTGLIVGFGLVTLLVTLIWGAMIGAGHSRPGLVGWCVFAALMLATAALGTLSVRAAMASSRARRR